MTLEEASTPRDGRLVVPTGWRQGRGAFGGLTIAAAIRAIEQRVADPSRAVRTVTAELPGPTLAGDAELHAEVLRAGRTMTTARAALVQGGETKTHAVAILAGPAPAIDGWNDFVPPAAPSWKTIEPLSLGSSAYGSSGPSGGPMVPGMWPEFAQHFEYRLVEGIPGSGGAATALGWIRPRAAGAARDAGYIAAMMDAWWPATLVRFRERRALATIAYTLEIVGGVTGLDPEAPLLYRGVVPVCEAGYFLETRELWSEDGRLVARNHQTFAIIAGGVSQSSG